MSRARDLADIADYSFDSERITSVGDPTAAQDVATKNYVDTATSAIGESAEKVIVTVDNKSGTTLSKGTPVHIVGATGNTFHIEAARADSDGAMPASGILQQQLTADQEGSMVVTGFVNGINTGDFAAGDEIYVAATGGYTNVAPTGESNLLQKLGVVSKVDSDNGAILLQGAGRTNAVPNLDDDQFFLGNGSNQAVATDFSTAVEAISINNVVEDTTPQLGGNLDLNSSNITGTGNINITGTLQTSSDVTVGGDLTVSGTTTTINTETINLADNNIVLNSNHSGAPTQNAGLTVERGTSTDRVFQWNETNDYWETDSDFNVTGTVTADGLDILGDNLVATIAGTNATSVYTAYKYNTTSTSGFIGSGSSILTGAGATDFIVRSQADLVFASNGNNRTMTLDTAGNVGIGTDDPLTKFDVKFDTNKHALLLSSANYSNGADLVATNDSGSEIALGFGGDTIEFYTNATERMRIDSSGNLLVGKTVTTLGTQGTLIASGQIQQTKSAGAPLLVNRTGSGGTEYGNIIDIRSNSATVGSIGVDGGSLVVGSGDAGIGFYQGIDSVVPYNATSNSLRDAALDLGYSNGRFRDLYLSGTAYIGGNAAWHAGNDGPGSGLNADTVDGIQGASFLRSDVDDSHSGTLTLDVVQVGNELRLPNNTSLTDVTLTATSDQDTGFNWSGSNAVNYVSGGVLKYNLNNVWHSGNDGSGSGLDADTLDGIQATGFLYRDITDSSRNINLNTGSTSADGGIWLGNSSDTHLLQLYASSSGLYYGFLDGKWASWDLRKTNGGNLEVDHGGTLYKVWDAYNDGTGSGLDADTVDGQHASAFQPAANELTWVDQATGNYGTIKVDDDRGVTWAGYAIRDDWVFMSNSDAAAGIYNDNDNEWALYATRNSSVELRANGTHELSAQNGYGYAPNSMRSPIFYDSNNTAYYADPASTSRFNAIEADGIHAADTGDYFTFYGDNSTNHSISSRDNNGNVADDIRINSYGGVWINLDSNNNNTSGADFRIGRHGGSGGMTSYGLFDVYGDSLYVDSAYSFRSQIFYDRDNTSYYTNPASTSVLNDIYLEGEIYHNGDTNTYIQFHAADQFRVVTGGIERLEVNNSQITSAEPIHAPSFHGDGSALTNVPSSANVGLVGIKNLIFANNRILNFVLGSTITAGTPVWVKIEHSGNPSAWRFNQNSSSQTQGWYYPVTTSTNYSGNFNLTDDTTAGTTLIPTVAMTTLNILFSTVAGEDFDAGNEIWVYHPNPTSSTFLQIWESGNSIGRLQFQLWQ